MKIPRVLLDDSSGGSGCIPILPQPMGCNAGVHSDRTVVGVVTQGLRESNTGILFIFFFITSYSLGVEHPALILRDRIFFQKINPMVQIAQKFFPVI